MNLPNLTDNIKLHLCLLFYQKMMDTRQFLHVQCFPQTQNQFCGAVAGDVSAQRERQGEDVEEMGRRTVGEKPVLEMNVGEDRLQREMVRQLAQI